VVKGGLPAADWKSCDVMSFAVRQLTKRYGGVTVLDGVELSVGDGEIHALLGANGAGKSTLIKCISGAEVPDGGEIDINGRVFGSLSPKEAREAGIAVIYQELSVIDTLDVTDNMFMNDELTRFGFRRRRKQRHESQEWLEKLGIDMDPRTVLGSVSTAKMQVIEIAKALRRSPEILILDEPTSSLSEAEVAALGNQMRMLRSQGLPILFITHRLSEVFEWADRVTVLRGGHVVYSGLVAETDKSTVIAAITTQTATETAGNDWHPRGASSAAAQSLLNVRGLIGPGYGPVDLDVYPNEILGVFGLVGSGRTEMVEALFGAERVHAGTVEVAGQRVNLRNPASAISDRKSVV
jgi:ribose transport system ATP-binding protein